MSSRPDTEARLRERARLLARPVQAQDDGGSNHLVVAVGAVQLAITVTALRQTVAPGPVTRLPGLPPELRGVRALRGDLVCLADTAALVGSVTSREPAVQHVVVLEDASPLGLLVDDVFGLLNVDTEAVHPAPVTGASAATLSALFAGVTATGTLVVDTAALLADPRLRLTPDTADEGPP